MIRSEGGCLYNQSLYLLPERRNMELTKKIQTEIGICSSMFIDGLTLHNLLRGLTIEDLFNCLEKEESIFKCTDSNMIGYLYMREDFDNIHFFNINDYNVIYLNRLTTDDNIKSLAYWRQKLNIPITHEFLSEFGRDVLDLADSESIFQARVFYWKYEKYFSEELWKSIIAEDTDIDDFKWYINGRVRECLKR